MCASVCTHARLWLDNPKYSSLHTRRRENLKSYLAMNQFAPNLACLFVETRKRFLEGSKLLGSSPGDGGFCSSETTIEKRRRDQSCLFRLGYCRNKTVLGSSTDEDVFCSSESKHDKRTAPRPKFLFRRENYRNKGHNPEYVLCLSPDKDGFFILS
jgi:hypothetical protein